MQGDGIQDDSYWCMVVRVGWNGTGFKILVLYTCMNAIQQDGIQDGSYGMVLRMGCKRWGFKVVATVRFYKCGASGGN